jgi:hypothetical protein
MGGKGSGGLRVGAGRRRKDQADGALTGSRRTRARAKQQNQTAPPNQSASNQTKAPVVTAPESVAPVDVEIPQPPGNLTLDELAEWNDLAPLAAKQGTLTNDTQWALVDLCQARVLKGKLLRDIDKYGNLVPGAGVGTVSANPLLARYTTLLQRVDAGMLRFRIAPMGKELTEPKKAADPFAEFDAAPAATEDGETIN